MFAAFWTFLSYFDSNFNSCVWSKVKCFWQQKVLNFCCLFSQQRFFTKFLAEFLHLEICLLFKITIFIWPKYVKNYVGKYGYLLDRERRKAICGMLISWMCGFHSPSPLLTKFSDMLRDITSFQLGGGGGGVISSKPNHKRHTRDKLLDLVVGLCQVISF